MEGDGFGVARMFKFTLGVALALWAGTSEAAETLRIGPPGPWVKPATRPGLPKGADESAPVRRLLSDIQVRLGGAGEERYQENASRLQTPAGLEAGAIALNWRPDVETLTVHFVHIIRNDQVIDVLGNGQTFTVLRREANLERAALDGALTATLQPEGLQVGDILDVAFTYAHHDPVMQGRTEMGFGLMPGPPVDHLRIRETWPVAKAITWRTTEGLDTPAVSKKDGQTELSIEMTNVERPKPPEGAPARYGRLASIEASEFSGFSEISALMAPLYRSATTLSVASPLRVEAARIRAASADPKAQAAAALRLVQDKVRYQFLGMNEGGLVPAPADLTWARRFGDCKGKTTLLLALLQTLGIEAEPALISVGGGDGLDQQLPMVELFDHVMVRARIAGKTYWLDGTRTGDRGLDALRIPPFHWALPVTASGANLEPLVVPPLLIPDSEIRVTIDQSGGLDAIGPTRVQIIKRGDTAIAMKLGLAAMSAKTAEENLRALWTRLDLAGDLKTVAFHFDEAAGEERITMDGDGPSSWPRDADSGARQSRVEGVNVGSAANFSRKSKIRPDAPFALPYPGFESSTVTVILPQRGRGFTVVGDDVDRTISGLVFQRSARIVDGVLTVVVNHKSIAPEFPAAEAPAVKIALRDLASQSVFVRAPKTYEDSEGESRIRLARTPSAPWEYLDRADARIHAGAYKDAVADFDQALRLKPGDARILNARCFGRAEAGRDLDLALADCNGALELDPKSAPFLDSRALVYFRTGKIEPALADLNAALKTEPNMPSALLVRGLIDRRRGDHRRAKAEIAAALVQDPTVERAYARLGIR